MAPQPGKMVFNTMRYRKSEIVQRSTSYALQFPRYSQDKILRFKITRARSNVNSGSHHDVAHQAWGQVHGAKYKYKYNYFAKLQVQVQVQVLISRVKYKYFEKLQVQVQVLL